jgi:DNA-directed RNA polymerase
MDDRLYQLMHDMGDKDIREKTQRLISAGRLSSTGPGAAVIGNAAGVVLKALKALTKSKNVTKPNAIRLRQLIADIGEERATAVTLRTLFNILGSHETARPAIPYLRNKIGKALKQEMEFLHLSRLEPLSYGYVAKELEAAGERGKAKIKRKILKRTSAALPSWDRADTYMLASAVLNLVIKEAGVFEIEQRVLQPLGFGKARLHNLVIIKPEIFEWITQGINSLAVCSPTYLPITQPPQDWIDDFRGGYAEGAVGRFNLFLSKSKRQIKTFRETPCEDLLRAVNTMQRTPWRINKAVFEVLELAVERDWTDPKVAIAPPPKPVRPETVFLEGTRQPEWVKYGRLKRQWNVLTSSYASARLRLARALSVGRVYVDCERLYFPHRIDFRGRCYPISAPIQYQGPDYQRGCLEFAEGKPVSTEEQLKYFLVHGANCFGTEKGTMERRCTWAQDNASKWAAVAEDPVANRLWVEADEPFQFLAWCLEYGKFAKEGLGFISHLPVCADGSNNGLQIYSLLLRDPVGGLATNCVPSPTPQDIYREVADNVTEKLLAYEAGDDAKEHRYAKRLLDFCKLREGERRVPRGAVKRPVMTLPYGSTLYSCQHYIAEWYHDWVRGRNLSQEELPFPEKDAYNIFLWLGKVVWDSIGDVVVKAREAMNWLREVSDILTSEGVHAEWTTPIGLKVRQDYLVGETKILQLRAGGQMRLRIWEEDDRIKGTSSRNGLCPNYIHSLDASAMFQTVNDASMEGVTCFQMIHDSYGTHAADAPTMARVLRQSFADIFSKDWLHSLQVELQASLPEGTLLPPPPTSGDLAITDLHQATYFFA